MSTLTTLRRVPWLGRAAAVGCAVALTLGAGVSFAAKPSPTPDQISQAEVTAMVRAIFQDASDAARYSVAVAAAEPQRQWPAGSIEAKLADGFRAMPAARRQAYADGAKALLTKPGTHFGQYGKQSPKDYAARGFAGAYADSPLPVDAARLGSGLKAHAGKPMTAPANGAKAAPIPAPGGEQEAICRDCDPPDCEIVGCDPTTPPSPRPKTGLKFNITRVVCVDETGSGVTEWGSDEIAFGGLIVTPGGETVQVGSYEIPQAFDDGTIWTFYNTPRTFGTFDLPMTYPGVYTASVMLTEIDAGGFAEVINTVWQQVRGTVQQKIAERVGQVLEPILRSQLVAQALGSLAGYFAVELISWIVNSFADDTFLQAGSSQLTLNSIDDTLPGGVFRFEGHDGIYDVYYSWTWRR